MKRKDVYKLIDTEREYQTKRWEDGLKKDRVADKDKSIADWVIYLDYLVQHAKDNVYFLSSEDAKEDIRKIAGVAVACMEHNITKSR